jgi:hypothetical protein
VIATHGVLRMFKALWLSAWPLCALFVFASLAATRLLPEGYPRAAVAAPILLLVPGALTLGAVFSQRRRPQGVAFLSYAALLSVVWAALASVALYVGGVLITAQSTFWCLFATSAVLAVVAEARLLVGPGSGRRALSNQEILDLDLSDAEVRETETPAVARRSAYYSILAVAAGGSLLAGGLYAYAHSPRPAPAGYTFMAWMGPPITGDIVVGVAGTKLHFQIAHRESDTTTFRLSAMWMGSPSRPLAKAVTLSIGPHETFRGALFVPPLPDGCTYRIALDLTAPRLTNPLTKKTQTWSINADVHDPNKSSKSCE